MYLPQHNLFNKYWLQAKYVSVTALDIQYMSKAHVLKIDDRYILT